MLMARLAGFGVLATFQALTPGRIGYILHTPGQNEVFRIFHSGKGLPKTGQAQAQVAQSDIVADIQAFREKNTERDD
jgi:hypothetical protein